MKEIKTSVETLEKKEVPKEIDEVKDILEAQKVIYKILAENAESIKRIDHEMDEWKKNNDKRKAPMDTIDKETNVSVVKAGKRDAGTLIGDFASIKQNVALFIQSIFVRNMHQTRNAKI